MPTPSASYTPIKWLAFFAELTAKLTHHNVLVVMEGAEILKRLLISRVSIAAFLQEGELLRRLADTLRVSLVVLSDQTGGPTTALNEELAFILLETLALTVNLMVSLHADADGYYSLLVMARAGALVEDLQLMMKSTPPLAFGHLCSILQQLLTLPFGRSVEADGSLHEAGFSRVEPSLPLRRHMDTLVESVAGHGQLLQYTAESLSEVVALQQGPRRFAAIQLLNTTLKHLEKLRRRRGSSNDAESSSGGGDAAAAATTTGGGGGHTDGNTTGISEFNVTITGAAPLALDSVCMSSGIAPSPLRDIEVGVMEASRAVPPPPSTEASTTVRPPQASSAAADVSAIVDAEPAHMTCDVPHRLATEAIAELAAATCHADFFRAMDIIWCLTVAGDAVVGEILSPESFDTAVRRFLSSGPRTRQDRSLFTMLLLWLGHLLSIGVLRGDTQATLRFMAAGPLLSLLRAELRKDGEGDAAPSPAPTRGASAMELMGSAQLSTLSLNVSAITPSQSIIGTGVPEENAGLSGLFNPVASATTPGPTLLAYSAARKAEEAALLMRPSISLILLSFLLNVCSASGSDMAVTLAESSGALATILETVRRAQNVRSALLDTPTTIDGALSDEVYLSYALRSVQSDTTTVAVLGCRLAASLLSRCQRLSSTALLCATAQSGLDLFTRELIPLCVHLALHNPTIMAAQEGGSASAVHYIPANLRCTRYTSLGECALVALDASLHYRQSPQRSKGGTEACPAVISLEALMRVLPAIARVSQRSIHAPIRAVVPRCLLYTCSNLADVLTVVRLMPSLATSSISSVLSYSSQSSQWEAAAAAGWLSAVLDMALEALENPSVHRLKGTGDRSTGATSTALPAQLEDCYHFAESPLSLKLMAIIASTVSRKTSAERSVMGVLYATAAFMILAVKLHHYSYQMWQCTMGTAGPAVSGESATAGNQRPLTATEGCEGQWSNALAPRGVSSLSHWLTILQHLTAENRRLARIWALHASNTQYMTANSTDGATPAQRTAVKDAAARTSTAAEHIGLQYSFTGSALQGLHALFQKHPSYATHFSGTLVCGVVEAALALPSPDELSSMIGARFAVHMDPPSCLVNGHQSAVEWACQLGAMWLRFDGHTNSRRCGLPASTAAAAAELCQRCLRILQNRRLCKRTRCHGTLLLSALLERAPATAQTVLEDYGASIFAASTDLHHFKCTNEMQCRLFCRVVSACTAASNSEWLEDRLKDLEETVQAARKRFGSPKTSRVSVTEEAIGASPDSCYTKYQIATSLLSSLLSEKKSSSDLGESRTSNMTSITFLAPLHRHRMCAALCEGLQQAPLLQTTLLAIRPMAESDEGRQCLLHDIATSGDPLGRNLLGRLLALTLCLPSRWRSPSPSTTSPSRTPRCKSGETRSGKGAPLLLPHPSAAVILGCEICTRVCSRSGAPFIASILKHRGIEFLATEMVASDRQVRRHGQLPTLPVHYLRLTAALSLDSDAARCLFQEAELMTVLIEVAGIASSVEPTLCTLSLLVLRNLCFHAGLKNLLCQDARVLWTLKAAAMGLKSVHRLIAHQLPSSVAAPLTPADLSPRTSRHGRDGGVAARDDSTLMDWVNQVAGYDALLQRRQQQRQSGVSPPGLPDAATTSTQPLLVVSTASANIRGASSPRHKGSGIRTSAEAGCNKKNCEEENYGGTPMAFDEVERATDAETQRRQRLAASALWSLFYDNQRGRSSVYAILAAEPAMTVQQIESSAGGKAATADAIRETSLPSS